MAEPWKRGVSSSLSSMAKYLRVCVADWHTKEICGFVICGTIKIADLLFAGWAHPRNLRICNSGMSLRTCGFAIFQTLNKICMPTISKSKVKAKLIRIKKNLYEKEFFNHLENSVLFWTSLEQISIAIDQYYFQSMLQLLSKENRGGPKVASIDQSN
jgi:hypothetical protein